MPPVCFRHRPNEAKAPLRFLRAKRHHSMAETTRGAVLRRTLSALTVCAAFGCGSSSTDLGAPDGGPDAGDPDLAGGRDGGSVPDGSSADGSDRFGLDQRPRNQTCIAPARPPNPNYDVALERAFASSGTFEKPLALVPVPGRADTYWLIEQPGRILGLDPQGRVSEIADLRARVEDGPNEAGLLGIAFHPQFGVNGRVFISYTARRSGQLYSRLVEMVSQNRSDLDPSSETLVLEVRQPAGNHNGGTVAFGSDGRLYFGLGDGGRANDVFANGQNQNTLLGAILRIDVDDAPPYSIPSDNPFAQGGGAPEIFAWGFRNPWRFSFDRATGELWAGDVGQGAIEEVDRVVLGGNYGWNIKEGTRCFSPSSGCDDSGLIDPIVEYRHSEGRSITGGYVYRGQSIPSLVGAYVYGDFVSGRIWAAVADPSTGNWRAERLLESGLPIASFAEDANGELYVLAWSGTIHRLIPDGNPPVSAFPDRLSRTGCVEESDPRRAAEGLIPYQPNAQLWSDGAEKTRFVALPEQRTIDIESSGDLTFPVGTVLLKHFLLGPQYVETRLFVRHEDGGWAGYSYAWEQDQSDARLIEGSRRVQWGNRDWVHPSRAECLSCHTAAAGRSLGLEIGQLDGDLLYEATGRRANQLRTWEHLGLFSGPVPAVRRIPAYDEMGAPVEDRAKAWLHTNCSVCHREGGTGRGMMDLRFETELLNMGICNEPPIHGDLGIGNPALLAPSAPARSILLERTRRLDIRRMPPLASEQVDTVGTALLETWIAGLQGCRP